MLVTGIALTVITSCAGNPPEAPDRARPFFFEAVQAAGESAARETITAEDGTELSYRLYEPDEPIAVAIFYHGGGAHSGAGYQIPACVLAEQYQFVVLTPDLRGHGASEGARGDAPSTTAVYRDIDLFVDLANTMWPGLPIALVGHSSGAGLLLNYSTNTDRLSQVRAFGFLAPFFGFRSKTEREPNAAPFSDAKVWPFALNAMSFGLLFGHYDAVTFFYPESVLDDDPSLLRSISVNMANAVTPSNPSRQLERLATPMAAWIGAGDELIDSDLLSAFVEEHQPSAELIVLPSVTHLEILEAGATALGDWLAAEMSE